MAIWVPLMSYYLCLLLFSSLPLALGGCTCTCCPPRWVVQWTDNSQGQFRSLVLRMVLVYPCNYSGAGECKSVGLTGLALAWYTAEPLCCA